MLVRLAGLLTGFPLNTALQVAPLQLSLSGSPKAYEPVQSPVPLLLVITGWLDGQVSVGTIAS